MSLPRLVARHSSHMSRVALLLAAEFGVEIEFKAVPDLTSEDPDEYGGNPTLKVPSLLVGDSPAFGALNVCRKLARSSDAEATILWPEQMTNDLLVNALEVTLNCMGSEVQLIMGRLASGSDTNRTKGGLHKARASLEGGTLWLERKLLDIVEALSDETRLSYFEVCLYCFVDHVEWREVLALDQFPRLSVFRDEFAKRPAAQATAYHFDS